MNVQVTLGCIIVNMRDILFRIHHQFCMSEESVPEYMFQKGSRVQTVPQPFFENVRCNARTCFSYPPPVFMSEESVSEYMFSKVVQSRQS